MCIREIYKYTPTFFQSLRPERIGNRYQYHSEERNQEIKEGIPFFIVIDLLRHFFQKMVTDLLKLLHNTNNIDAILLESTRIFKYSLSI